MTLGRRVISTTALLTLSSVLVRSLTILTMPVLTHLLPPSAYGTAALVTSIIGLTAVVGLAGMDMSYLRSYYASGPASGERAEIFVWRFTISAGALTGAALFVSWPLIADAFALPGYLGALAGLAVALQVCSTMAQARARLHLHYRAAAISILIAGIGALATTLSLAYWWRQDELPIVLSLVTINLLPILILGAPPVRKLIAPSGLAPRELASVAKIGIAGIATAPLYWVLISSDRWFLGHFDGTAAVGVYAIAYGLGTIGLMINTAIFAVWTPESAREYEQNPSTAADHLGLLAEHVLVAFACTWLAVTAAGGDLIRLLTAKPFHAAADLIPLLAAGVFAHGVSHLFNATLLLKKRLDYAAWCWLGGALLSLLLNVILVPRFGAVGAALTQAISLAAVAFGIAIGAQRLYPLRVRFAWVATVTSGIAAAGIVMHPAWSDSPLTSLLAKLPVGLLVLLVVVRLAAPEVYQGIRQRISRRSARP